jgi:hypothetical protein
MGTVKYLVREKCHEKKWTCSRKEKTSKETDQIEFRLNLWTEDRPYRTSPNKWRVEPSSLGVHTCLVDTELLVRQDGRVTRPAARFYILRPQADQMMCTDTETSSSCSRRRCASARFPLLFSVIYLSLIRTWVIQVLELMVREAK